MGEQLQLSSEPLERDYDPVHRRATAERPPEERLALGISWNRLAGRWPAAGRPLGGGLVPDTPLDAERILRALAEHEVQYVLIGGLAAQIYGPMRAEGYAELIPAPDPANLECLAAALRELDARVLNEGHEDTAIEAGMLPRATIWQFTTRDGGIDVMHDVPGGDPYAELSERAIHVRLGDFDVPVVDLDDLIRMKLARGRPLDLADVAALTDPDAA
jgi:hypothetical protein